MSYNPLNYRNNKDGIGSPGDDVAANSTDPNTLVSLAKKLVALLSGTISVSAPVGGATSVKQDTGNASLASIDDKLTTLNLSTDTLEPALGAIAETAPASDTASSGLNGRLQRVAQRITSLIGLLPTSLGAKTAAGSLSVVTATDDVSLTNLGGLTETAPASDTASSGLNGRLQRIAQRITALLAVFPATIDTNSGNKSASTLRVVLATDQPSLTNAQPVSMADNSNVTFGAKADAKSTATDATAISAMSVFKQISASVQAIATSAASLVTGTVLAAGTALIGRAVADASAATGGIATTARLPSAAASTNAANVKNSAGRVYALSGKNNASYDVFIVLYDSAAAPPVPGTTAIRKKMVCPAGQAFVYDFPLGLSFAAGIGYAFTKLVADADTTALVAGDVTAFNMDYV